MSFPDSNKYQTAATHGAEAVHDNTDLEVLANRFDEILSFIHCQGEAVERVDCKLRGGLMSPKDQSNAQPPRPVPAGMLGRLQQTADDMMARLHRTDESVSRLSKTI